MNDISDNFGFIISAPTLFSGTFLFQKQIYHCQITDFQVLLLNNKRNFSWKSDCKIVIGMIEDEFIFITNGYRNLIVLKFDNDEILEINRRSLDLDVSCFTCLSLVTS